MGSAGSLSPALYPPVSLSGHVLAYVSPLRLLGNLDMPWHFTDRSGGFHGLLRSGVRVNIVQTLLDLSEISQAIDSSTLRDPTNKSLTLLLDSRAHLMYRLLNLPTEAEGVLDEDAVRLGEWTERDRVMQIYGCLRRVSLLYSVHVIFVLPRLATIRDQLVPDIRATYTWSQDMDLSRAERQMLVWTCMIAAIAVSADDPNQEEWFAIELRKHASVLNIGTYDELRAVLRLFGWVDAACDSHGQKVWSSADT